jgi:hypothetical protein
MILKGAIMKRANATLSVINWNRSWLDEQPSVGDSGAELFQMEVKVQYHGELEGEGIIHYLFADNPDRKGSFVGLEKVTGSVAGRSGSFIFQHTGTFDNDHIVDTLIVLPGSGDGSLQGISGTVLFDIPNHMETYPFTFYFAV